MYKEFMHLSFLFLKGLPAAIVITVLIVGMITDDNQYKNEHQ